LQGLRAAAGVPFEEARAMPPEVYVSPDFTALELAHVLARDWYCVGRVDGWRSPAIT
jgi:phenylpropionate dioxygenase-like ring-hydroxylating dioxygenase large terminal subunit